MSANWPGDGRSLRGTGFDDLLVWCANQGASRIEIQTGKQVCIRVHGRNRTVSSSPILPSEVESAVNHVYGSASGVGVITKGLPLDLSHCVQPDRSKPRHSFRLNILGTQVGSERGMSMVIRPLVDIPRKLEEQNVEPGILEALQHDNGGFLICGATGSGKTTLIGGINRWRLEDPGQHVDLMEGSAPIEILYDLVEARHATVSQIEIPRHLPSFAEFVRAAMRREPTDICLTEIRDPETMEAAIQAMISGHRLTSSIHTFNCASTMRRVASLCPADQRDSLTIAFVENLRLIVNQRLLPSTDGRRTPIREFLPVTRALRSQLLDSPQKHWPQITNEAVETQGQSFQTAIRTALDEGRITEDTAAKANQEEE
ncbi:Flp pilus assembly complex ATPase component TadA [Gluconacetobacter diazotrophicus]|uniref:Flp pilus assembly complex ATPase component TadA n=1 Tax=Gluconacetobacter diazotrophicus TaxID=33996 RepID=A0A7W4FF56_GLUDI|nr:ATPase, T2SS/T4P/T4SS family [Gluconacetobacter diazotrophicus]MBB2156610.1 Flp pilus assembly complex ATPase component TadA [Gluconacetobacter diazotrophicus]